MKLEILCLSRKFFELALIFFFLVAEDQFALTFLVEDSFNMFLDLFNAMIRLESSF